MHVYTDGSAHAMSSIRLCYGGWGTFISSLSPVLQQVCAPISESEDCYAFVKEGCDKCSNGHYQVSRAEIRVQAKGSFRFEAGH